jgi:hypothetical protein
MSQGVGPQHIIGCKLSASSTTHTAAAAAAGRAVMQLLSTTCVPQQQQQQVLVATHTGATLGLAYVTWRPRNLSCCDSASSSGGGRQAVLLCTLCAAAAAAARGSGISGNALGQRLELGWVFFSCVVPRLIGALWALAGG